MTAEEWEACRDPRKMLARLGAEASGRKLRLFACACARRVWHLIPEGQREGVCLAEAYADAPRRGGLHAARRQGQDEGERAMDESTRARGRIRYFRAEARNWASSAAWEVARQNPLTAAKAHLAVAQAAGFWRQAEEEARVSRPRHGRLYAPPSPEELHAQVDLLRCIFGNPFRPPFTITPTVRFHDDGAAVKLATVIYEERSLPSGELDPVRLAILADALEESGVGDAASLAHLRGPGPHCRGCHVVDAILGRS